MYIEWDTLYQKISKLADETSTCDVSELPELAIELADLAGYLEEVIETTKIARLSKRIRSAECLIKKQAARIELLENLLNLSTDQVIDYYVKKYQELEKLSDEKVQEAEKTVRIAEQKAIYEAQKARVTVSKNKSHFQQEIQKLKISNQELYHEFVLAIVENERLQRIVDEQKTRIQYFERYKRKPLRSINDTTRKNQKKVRDSNGPKDTSRKLLKSKGTVGQVERVLPTEIEEKASIIRKRYNKPTPIQLQPLLEKNTNTSISELGLSFTVKTRLLRWSVRYIEQLAEYNDDRLLSIPGIDNESLYEIRSKLFLYLEKLARSAK